MNHKGVITSSTARWPFLRLSQQSLFPKQSYLFLLEPLDNIYMFVMKTVCKMKLSISSNYSKNNPGVAFGQVFSMETETITFNAG